MNDGLVNNHIQSVFQDDDGFIWFATFTGISIYDGHQFINYTAENGGITDNMILGFFKKNHDETWVIENSCTEIFVKRKRVKKITIKGFGFEPNSYLLTKHGRVLVSRDQNIFEIKNLEPDSIAHLGKAIQKMFEVGNYFLLKDAGSDSIYITDTTFHILQTANGKIFKDHHNRFWFLDSEFHLLDTIALQQGTFQLLPAAFQLRRNNIHAQEIKDFLADKDGFYWLLSETKGILRIDDEGNATTYNLSPENLSAVPFMEDAEGNVWMPVPSIGGIVKFFNKYIDVYTVNNGLPSNWIYSVSEDAKNHSVWLANKKTISCIYRNRVFNFPYPANHIESGWIHVSVQHDSLWLSAKGVFVYKIFYTPQPHLQLLKHWTLDNGEDDMTGKIQRDGESAFFVPIEWHGLYRGTNDGKLQKIYSHEHVGSVLIDGKELWMASKSDGLLRWKMTPENNGASLQLLQHYRHLPDDQIFYIKKDHQGNIWAGTIKKGIIKFEKQKNDSFVIKNYYAKEALNGWVITISIGNRGQVYVGTLGGFFELHESPDSTYFENISKKFALEGQIYEIVEAADGNFWLATDEGVIHVRTNMYRTPPPPKIFFTQMLMNNLPDTSISLSYPRKIFSYKENNLTFTFSATSFINEHHVVYSYQLNKDGDTSQWSVPQSIHTLSLLSLSPGSYDLRVKAVAQGNICSEIPAQYSFIINAPFWSTWWFRVSVLLLVAFIVAAFYKYRLEQLRKVMRIRFKISRDLHDEIGPTLSGIGLISEMGKHEIENNNYTGVKNVLDKISTHSEEILGKMSDIVWAINPLNDTFEKMLHRLKTYSTSIAAPIGVQVHFQSEKSLRHFNLSMQQRNNVYLICKEAMNNAIKYSQCQNLYFSLSSKDHRCEILIRDDGKGFDASKGFDGNGLKNMRSRAEEIKAGFTVESENKKGTFIKLSLKIT